MHVEIKIYDEHVKELVKRLDKAARKVDLAKYGLPPKDEAIPLIIYDWLHERGKAFKAETQAKPGIVNGCGHMKPEEFVSFEESKPEKNKWLIVTNNVNALNAFGEMSHVWLTTFWAKSENPQDGIITFDCCDRKVLGLTHWKYA